MISKEMTVNAKAAKLKPDQNSPTRTKDDAMG